MVTTRELSDRGRCHGDCEVLVGTVVYRGAVWKLDGKLYVYYQDRPVEVEWQTDPHDDDVGTYVVVNK